MFARAQIVLDQSLIAPFNGSEYINEGFSPVAQIFTAGLGGTLAGVNVAIQSQSIYPLQVSIYGVTGGVPNSVALGQTTLNQSAITLNDLITFPETVSLTAGDQYAIEVDYSGGPPPGPGHGQGVWEGAFGADDYYPAGYELAFNGANWVRDSSGDLLFQTYIGSVPEPSTLALLAASSLLVIAHLIGSASHARLFKICSPRQNTGN